MGGYHEELVHDCSRNRHAKWSRRHGCRPSDVRSPGLADHSAPSRGAGSRSCSGAVGRPNAHAWRYASIAGSDRGVDAACERSGGGEPHQDRTFDALKRPASLTRHGVATAPALARLRSAPRRQSHRNVKVTTRRTDTQRNGFSSRKPCTESNRSWRFFSIITMWVPSPIKSYCFQAA
jgi:hypothetical protein